MGVEMHRAALSPDGKKLALRGGGESANIFRVPLLADRPATWMDATQLTFDEAEYESLDISGDGRIVVGSDRLGELGHMDDPRRRRRSPSALDRCGDGCLLRVGRPTGMTSSSSPPGPGHRESAMPAEGGPAQLTRGESESIWPDYSPAGHEVVKEGERTGSRHRLLSDGGAAG